VLRMYSWTIRIFRIFRNKKQVINGNSRFIIYRIRELQDIKERYKVNQAQLGDQLKSCHNMPSLVGINHDYIVRVLLM